MATMIFLAWTMLMLLEYLFACCIFKHDRFLILYDMLIGLDIVIYRNIDLTVIAQGLSDIASKLSKTQNHRMVFGAHRLHGKLPHPSLRFQSYLSVDCGY